ncbi:MAG: hypothetical protein IBX39_00045 [Candidatus Methanoperedenaceae archaeon]|nr:hypothetical protein [Candidatus Methanoperedenaceae archaeon]
MKIDKIHSLSTKDIFVDTNILFKKLDGKQSEYYKLSKTKKFHASKFSILEFKRTLIKDCVSLYYLLLDNNNDLGMAYRRINNMTENPQYKRQAANWITILKVLGFPNKSERSIIQKLRILITFGLESKFKENVTFIDSVIKCDKIYIKPKKYKEGFLFKVGCGGCEKFHNSIERSVLENVYNVIHPIEKENDVDKICLSLVKIIQNKEIENHDCVMLGDIIISIDAPLEMPILTKDPHLVPICSSLNKEVICLEK